jgi:hypothetical protein
MDRRVVLERGAATTGASLVKLVCESLRSQGREVEGGWPGTIAEARACVASRLHEELATRGLSPLGKDELDSAANATYAHAKKHWLELERATRSAARARTARG